MRGSDADPAVTCGANTESVAPDWGADSGKPYPATGQPSVKKILVSGGVFACLKVAREVLYFLLFTARLCVISRSNRIHFTAYQARLPCTKNLKYFLVVKLSFHATEMY